VGLPEAAQESHVRALFAPCGVIARAFPIKLRTAWIVVFIDCSAIDNALALDQRKVGLSLGAPQDCHLAVELSQPPSKKKRKARKGKAAD
jgi:hypothetical protein